MITSPIRKSYIGQTCRPIQERLQEHQTGKSSRCRGIYGAIKKYGWENFEIDWYECPDDDLNKHERWMVNLMGTLSPGGYNLMEGGGSGGKRSEETIQRMSEAQRGEKHYLYGKSPSEETKERMSDAHRGEKSYMFGIPKSEETKQKIGDAQRGEKSYMFGIPKSEETKQKMSEAKQGDKHPKSKRVYQYDLDGNYITSFGSAREAARQLKEKYGYLINKCARSEQKTAYNFKWSYSQLI